MLPTLLLRFRPESDDIEVGELVVMATCDGLSGTGAWYFRRDEIETKLIDRLGGFPLPLEPIVLEGGIWDQSSSRVVEPRLTLTFCRSVRLQNVRVTLAVCVPEAVSYSFSVAFDANYSDLNAFRKEVRAMLEGQRNSACLCGI